MNPTTIKQSLAAAASTSPSAIGLFSSLATAAANQGRSVKPSRIMLVDHGFYAVVPPRVADALHQSGYAYA